jgi:hypothetical protein
MGSGRVWLNGRVKATGLGYERANEQDTGQFGTIVSNCFFQFNRPVGGWCALNIFQHLKRCIQSIAQIGGRSGATSQMAGSYKLDLGIRPFGKKHPSGNLNLNGAAEDPISGGDIKIDKWCAVGTTEGWWMGSSGQGINPFPSFSGSDSSQKP